MKMISIIILMLMMVVLATTVNAGIVDWFMGLFGEEPMLNESIEKPKVEKRYWNLNTYNLTDNKSKTEIYGSWVNWFDFDNKWKLINTSWTFNGSIFIMQNAPFIAEAPFYSNGKGKFISNVRYDIFNKEIITDVPLIETTIALDVNVVEGYIDTIEIKGENHSVVIYPNAYSFGDLIYWVEYKVTPRLTRLVRFNNNPQRKTDISFLMSYDDEVDFTSKGNKWNKSKELHTNKSISIKNPITHERRGIGKPDFYVWDSNNTMKSINIKLKEMRDGTYTFTKTITKKFLDNAVYPVFTDDTDTFYPNPHIEITTVDGRAIRYNMNVIWADIRGDAGNLGDDTAITGEMFRIETSATENDWEDMYRSVYLFDVSALSGSTIESINVSIYGFGSSVDAFTDSASLVDSNPASNIALIAGDYTTLGTTKYANDIAVSSWDTDNYNNFIVNATGISFVQTAIDGDGIVKFGIRSTYDTDNVEPTWQDSKKSQITGYFAEQVGTSQDPKLVIVHFPPDADPPSFSAITDNSTATLYNGTDVQINITIEDNTGINYFTYSHNDTDGFIWTNETLIDADGATSLKYIVNHSIKWFPTEGGTLGVRFWANDTLGNSDVSDIHTITIQPIVTDTCTCPSPASNWNVNCIDNCSVNTACDISDYNLYINGGIGRFIVNEDLYFTDIFWEKGCKIRFLPDKLHKS